ncbi:MAG: CotH kinase family protein [Lentimicrobiaceae bacterium]|nr:CotH kinase family protein [Lentimicrobiaceae bacterium]
MIKLYILAFLFFLLPVSVFSQKNTLFDDTKVSSININLPADSLQVILTDVLSNHYFMAQFVFSDGILHDTLQNTGFRLRGNTSRYSQKKSFKISFNTYAPGRKYQGVKKINLNGQHNDPTLIREKLFYDVWKNARMPERRTSFVKLYINGEYFGLYTNLEEMDKEWLSRVFDDNDGNLYKCTYPADLVYLGDDPQTYKNIGSSSATGGRAYDLQTNETLDDYTGLVHFIRLLSIKNNTTFPDSISKRLNVKAYLKAYAIDIATGNWDDYAYNKNNYYLYDNPTSGKFDFISYDTDNTFGVDWMGKDWATRNCLDWVNHSEARPMVTQLLKVPVFFTLYKQYLDTIMREIIHPDTIFPRIESLKNLITQAALADTYRTLDWGYDDQDFYNGFEQAIDGHTPYGIKPFILTRRQTIIEQLNAAKTPEVVPGSLTIIPNPADNYISLILPGNVVNNVHCIIYNMQGVICGEWNNPDLNNTSVMFPIHKLPAGMYIVKVQTGQVVYTSMFVKK